MEVDVAGLSDEGARVLVQEMTRSGWNLVRSGFARLFGRDAEDDRVLADLEEAREDLLRDSGETADIEAEWRRRFRRLLRENPDAARRLRALLDEHAPERERGDIHNTSIGDVHGILFQVGRVDRIDHNHHTGDHVDLRGARAERDVIGTQNNHGGHGPPER